MKVRPPDEPLCPTMLMWCIHTEHDDCIFITCVLVDILHLWHCKYVTYLIRKAKATYLIIYIATCTTAILKTPSQNELKHVSKQNCLIVQIICEFSDEIQFKIQEDVHSNEVNLCEKFFPIC